MTQCTHGALQTFGDEFDMAYETTGGWNARRASLTGMGRITVHPSHFVNALLRVKLPDAGNGRKAWTYSEVDRLVFDELTHWMEEILLLSNPYFTLKLHRIAQLFRDLRAARLLPTSGSYDIAELALLIKAGIAQLPAAQKEVKVIDPIPAEDTTPNSNKIFFDYITIKRMQQADLYNGALIRQVRNLMIGSWTLGERIDQDGTFAGICSLLVPQAVINVQPRLQVATVLGFIASTLQMPLSCELHVDTDTLPDEVARRQGTSEEARFMPLFQRKWMTFPALPLAFPGASAKGPQAGFDVAQFAQSLLPRLKIGKQLVPSSLSALNALLAGSTSTEGLISHIDTESLRNASDPDRCEALVAAFNKRDKATSTIISTHR